MVIKSEHEIANFCKIASNKKILFLDTEFDRKTTYYSKLSYISIYDGTKFWIIDALNNPNLHLLNKIISSNKITKVIHGSHQDLEIFKNLNIKIEKLFDTQIAAQFCGHEQPISYYHAVNKLCNIELNKDLQNTDWLKRPINKQRLEYLKNDVKYLKKIYNYFYKKLKKNKNLNFFYEEMNSLKNVKKILSTSFIRKRINSQTIKKKIFQKLLLSRENIASNKNIPKNWVFKDEQLLNMINNKNFDEIKKNKNLISSEKKLLIKILATIKLVKNKKIFFNKNIINILNIYKSEVSKKYQISDQLISNSYELKNYLENNIKKEGKWREKIFYKITDKFLKKEIKIKIKKNQIFFY